MLRRKAHNSVNYTKLNIMAWVVAPLIWPNPDFHSKSPVRSSSDRIFQCNCGYPVFNHLLYTGAFSILLLLMFKEIFLFISEDKLEFVSHLVSGRYIRNCADSITAIFTLPIRFCFVIEMYLNKNKNTFWYFVHESRRELCWREQAAKYCMHFTVLRLVVDSETGTSK